MDRLEKTELAVIGAGPGGYTAAFLAADYGMKVTLIDPEANPGGVCLHRGCIPSKTLLHVSRLLNEANGAKQYGITFGKPKIDIDRLRSWKNHVVEQLTGGLGQLCVRRKVNFVQGKAQFVDPTNLKVTRARGDSHCLEFEHAIIATGSHPIPVPGFPQDSPQIMGSSGALSLEKIPETLCVVGGGYIGLELGTVYAALGSKVTVVEMLSSLLPGADRDLVRFLVKSLKEKFSTIMTDTKVTRVETKEIGIRLYFENKSGEVSDQSFEKVLVSIGRRPNTKGLGIENTAIEIDTKGFIKTDVLKCTREPSIYAVGDVTSQPMLAHKASHEGRIAVEAIRGNKPAFESRVIPAVVFCDPEIAWCGLTEREAKAQSRNYTTTRFPWAASGRALAQGHTEGMTKLLIDPYSERILGVGIVGSGAGELIAEGVLAMEMASRASDLKLTIHPHPTLSETIMEAAEVFFGTSTHIYRPKR